MHQILLFLVTPLVSVFGSPISLGDLLGFATGLGCVFLASRASIWNFPVGIANSIILAAVFFQSRLYGDMSLQAAFLVLGIQGWSRWMKQPGALEAPPREPCLRDHLVGVPVVVATALVLRELLVLAGGAAPWPDAFITSASLWAQWLLNRKSVSTWVWWIAVDVVSIPLYWSRNLPLIALLYVVFLVLCIQGWRSWNRSLTTSKACAA